MSRNPAPAVDAACHIDVCRDLALSAVDAYEDAFTRVLMLGGKLAPNGKVPVAFLDDAFLADVGAVLTSEAKLSEAMAPVRGALLAGRTSHAACEPIALYNTNVSTWHDAVVAALHSFINVCLRGQEWEWRGMPAWLLKCTHKIEDDQAAQGDDELRHYYEWLHKQVCSLKGPSLTKLRAEVECEAAWAKAAMTGAHQAASLPELNETDQKIAAYIRQNPGCGSKAAAQHAHVEPERVRTIMQRKLKPHGFTSDGKYYYPPAAS